MSAITQARVDAREMVRCVDCDLVQFVTLEGNCRRCHKAVVYPFDSVEETPPVPSDPAPQDREEVFAPALLDRGWRTPKSNAPTVTTCRGKTLTKRQLDALDLLATGRSDLKIALKLGLSRHTVKQYLSSASSRMGLLDTNRIKLAIWWKSELFQIGLREVGLL